MAITVEGVALEIGVSADGAASGLEKLENTLMRLKSIASGGAGLNPVVNGLNKLRDSVNAINAGAGEKLSAIANGIEKLNGVRISASIGNQIRSILETSKSMRDADFSPLERMGQALEPLSKMTERATGLQSIFTQLKKVPELANTLDQVDMNRFNSQIRDLSGALDPLASKLNIVKNGVSALNAEMKGLSGAAPSAASAQFGGLTGLLRTGFSLALIRKGVQLIKSAVTNSAEYVENLNLFTVSLGEYAGEALAYAEQVRDAMGIDPSEWIRNQGTFNQIALGFGMAADQAYALSRGLTQVAYDIASFYNISTGTAMEKVRAGLAGEIEPLRALGYALDNNTLQEIAYANGISTRVANMTQAQKAELRYVAILSQSKNAMGDMSRTINTSSNQIRILQSQAALLGRAFGNIFIPAVNAALPVLINFVNVVTSALNAIANLFGFSLPTISWDSGLGSAAGALGDAEDAAGGLGDNLGSAGGAAAKLKRTLMGFDELNVLNDTSGGGGGGGAGGAGGASGGGALGFNLSDYIYDFMDGLQSRIDSLWETLTPGQALIAAIGEGLAMWAVSSAFLKNLDSMSRLLQVIGGVALTLAAMAIMVKFVYEFDRRFLSTGNPTYLLADAISTAFATGIAWKTVGKIFGGTAAWSASGIVLGISAVTSLAATLGDIRANGVNWNNAVSGLFSAVKGGLAGAAVAKALGMSMLAGAGIGFGITAAAALVLGAIVATAPKSLKPQWGDTSLSEEQIQSLVDYLVDPTGDGYPARISLASAEIEKAETFDSSYSTAVQNFQTNLGLLNVYNSLSVTPEGIQVTPLNTEQLNDLNESIAGVIETAEASLKQQTIKVNALVSIFASDQEGNPTDIGSQIMQTTAQINANTSERLAELGQALGQTYSDAYADGIVDFDEQQAIQELLTKFNTINDAIQAYNREKEWSEFVGENGLSSLTEETFAGAWQKSKTYLGELKQQTKAEAINLESELRGSAAYAKKVMESYKPDTTEYVSNLALFRQQVVNLAGLLGVDISNELMDTPEQIQAVLDKLPPINADAYAASVVSEIQTRLREYFVPAIQEIFGDTFSDPNTLANMLDNVNYINTYEGFNVEKIGLSVLDGLNSVFKDYGIDLSELGITGYEALSSDMKESLRQSLLLVLSPEQVDQIFGFLDETVQSSASSALSDGIENATVSDSAASAAQSAAQSALSGVGSSLEMDDVDLSALKDVPDMLKKVGRQAAVSALSTTLLNTSVTGLNGNLETLGATTVQPTIDVKDNASKAVKDLTSSLGKLRGTFNSRLNITASVSSGVKTVASAMATILSGGSVAAAFRTLARFTAMAKGGIAKQGTMFLAGESGAEIVGQVGSRTGVVNREQISDIIASEMARQGGGNDARIVDAVCAALSGMELTVDGVALGKVSVKAINAYQRKTGRIELQL